VRSNFREAESRNFRETEKCLPQVIGVDFTASPKCRLFSASRLTPDLA
jgi:hypothetical protein